jgi:hypothetical protein
MSHSSSKTEGTAAWQFERDTKEEKTALLEREGATARS